MKRLLFFVAGCLMVACNMTEDVENQVVSKKLFHATIDDESTRTFVDEKIRLRWTEGDLISLFEGTTRNKQYKFLGETGDNAGDFEDITTGFGSGNDIDRYYAIYPYSSSTKLHEDGYIIYNFPEEQTYAENSFGLGANPMVAVTSDLNDFDLCFRNAAGYLRLYLYGEDVTIKSIKIEGNNSEPLAGKAYITPEFGGFPTTEMDETATTTVTLNCSSGVKIGTTAETATPFWIALPPTVFSKGFTATFTDLSGHEFTKTFTSNINIARNKYISAKIEFKKPAIPYVTFSASAEQTLTMSKAVETLEYSVNDGNWAELGTNTITFGGEFGDLQLRGKNTYGTVEKPLDNFIYEKNCAIIIFGNDTEVSSSGDIRTIVDYENYANANTGNARFCYLFKNCHNLTSAPELPAETLATYCYYHMFWNCKNLTQPPILPATTLADYCYWGIFRGCEKLASAPDLPATKLAQRCYCEMFKGCTNLINTPHLPAINLATGGYSAMFENCTNLKFPPNLPATTLATSCYRAMFKGCSSITSAPNLPAKVLAEECYSNMFNDCTSLTKAPELPALSLAEECYWAMFANCTSLTTTPELPATILSSGCYGMMFSGCSKLSTTTNLPATTMTYRCYDSMFASCTNLTSTPDLPAIKLANQCYYGMFELCRNLQTPPALPATDLAEGCYQFMFRYCSNLTRSPILRATTLAKSCYNQMFCYCGNIKEITMLATDINADDCLTNWVKYTSSTGSFIKSSAMTTLPEGNNVIPTGWTVKNYGE
ncbi:MAG: hypothetical protein IIW65_03970 [Alistipes sp.]|nr:hypothetical protein [Alistipes sp.]